MIERLPEPTEKNPNPREELDNSLTVAEWEVERRKIAPDVPAGAPSWWRGEEDASISFLKAMGIRLDEEGNPVPR